MPLLLQMLLLLLAANGPSPRLQWRIQSASHPSGIYREGQNGSAQLLIGNDTRHAIALRGPLRLMRRRQTGPHAGRAALFQLRRSRRPWCPPAIACD